MRPCGGASRATWPGSDAGLAELSAVRPAALLAAHVLPDVRAVPSGDMARAAARARGRGADHRVPLACKRAERGSDRGAARHDVAVGWDFIPFDAVRDHQLGGSLLRGVIRDAGGARRVVRHCAAAYDVSSDQEWRAVVGPGGVHCRDRTAPALGTRDGSDVDAGRVVRAHA